MTDTRELLGHCEACSLPIHEGDLSTYGGPDGIRLCRTHSPLLSDVVKQYARIAEEGDWESYDAWADEAEFYADKAEVEADLAENGDRTTATEA